MGKFFLLSLVISLIVFLKAQQPYPVYIPYPVYPQLFYPYPFPPGYYPSGGFYPQPNLPNQQSPPQPPQVSGKDNKVVGSLN